MSVQCPICELANVEFLEAYTRTDRIKCRRCGQFEITSEAYNPINNAFPTEKRPIVSYWIRQENNIGFTPKITEENFRSILQIRPLSFSERAKQLLAFMEKNTTGFGRDLKLIEMPAAFATIQSFEQEELRFIAEFLIEQGWIKSSVPGSPAYHLTGNGFQKVNEWYRSPSESSQGFVAMWFNADLDDAWNHGLNKGIEDAGFSPRIIKEKEHSNKICDEIIGEIRQSRFVVADFTGHRGGVYFEAGFAMGLGLPVIWTCRKDHMDDLHFDIRQYNCIDWQEPSELRDRLTKRIVAVIGRGPIPKKTS